MPAPEWASRWREADAGQAALALLCAAVAGMAFSISVGQGLAVLCLVVWGVALARRRARLTMSATAWLAVAFIVLALVTAVVAAGPSALRRHAGKLFWFVFIPLAASLVTTPARGRALLRAFVAGTGVLAVVNWIATPWEAARQVARGVMPRDSYLDHIVHLGSMTGGEMLMLGIVGGLVLIAVGRRQGRRVWPWAVLLVVQVLALGLTFKRGSWVVAVVLVVALAGTLRQWKVLLALAVLVAAAFLLPPVRARLAQTGKDLSLDGGGRLTMWFRVAPVLVREHPWGIGYGAMTPELMHSVVPTVEKERNHLHSNLAEVLVETGWLGLALYLAWMAAALAAAARAVRRTWTVGPAVAFPALAGLLMLSGLLLNGLVEYNFGDSELILVYAVLMGLPGAWAAAGEGGRLQSL